MTRLSEATTVWSVNYRALVSDAPPVDLTRVMSRDRVKAIDPRHVRVEWVATPDRQWLQVSIVGRIIKADGEPGERTQTRQWGIEYTTPPVRDLPRWVRDIIEDQIASNHIPHWAVELWKRQDG
jgi:hypothetical protein